MSARSTICGVDPRTWRSNCLALAKHFLPGWQHKRVDEELGKVKAISEKRSLAGHQGGIVSRHKEGNQRHVSRSNMQANAKQLAAYLALELENLPSSSFPEKEEEKEPKGPVVDGSLASALPDGRARSPSDQPQKKEGEEKENRRFPLASVLGCQQGLG